MRAFKAGLFVLLAANAVYFAVFESTSKAVDSAAWFALLVLFEAEAGFGDRLRAGRTRQVVRAARLIAAAGVIAAGTGYVLEGNALDAANSVLWILVVLLIEAKLRLPVLAERNRNAFRAAAIVVFGGLAMLAALWAAAGMWIDAYDAALWLIAYAALEQAVSNRPRESPLQRAV